jgi:tRNA pseudouridine55 synthase
VSIRDFRLLSMHGSELEFEVACSSGTYVRALAQELGQALGCGGHLTALRRTVAGAFRLDQARTLVELQDLAEAGRVADALLPNAALLPEMPGIRVDATAARLLTQGGSVEAAGTLRNDLVHESWCRILGSDGALLGLAQVEAGGRLHPRIVLVEPAPPGAAASAS